MRTPGMMCACVSPVSTRALRVGAELLADAVAVEPRRRGFLCDRRAGRVSSRLQHGIYLGGHLRPGPSRSGRGGTATAQKAKPT